jgi:iron complex outermembrane receptor protein
MAVVRRLFLIAAGSLFLAAPLSAQEPTGNLRGVVRDSATRQPLADVTVSIPGTRRGAVTAADGTFLLTGIPVGVQRVRASRIGHAPQFQTVTIAAGATPEVDFTLAAQALQLSEVVTTGYGTQRRLALTGSIASIDANAANVGVPANVTNLIEGRAAGVQITQNSGDPGAGAQIRIRGGTSISASNEPLYVIDGVPIAAVEPEDRGVGIGGDPPLSRNPMNLINPADIASISILKDAAAAIYGTRAANGVILIETKKGRPGASSMEYEVQAGWSSPRTYLDVLSGDQYRSFVNDQVKAGVLQPQSLAALGNANTDWERAVTRSAPTVNHNLSFSGGSSNTQYRASINYLDQEGIVLSSGMRRYQARLNGTHQALDGRLRLALNMTAAHIKNDYLPYENTGGFEGGVFINMLNFNPTFPVTVPNASTGGSDYFEIGPGSQSVRNPVALANQVQDFGTSTRTLGNISADFDVIQNLTFRVNVGADRINGTRDTYIPRISPAGAPFNGLARQTDRDNTSTTLQTVLTFHPQFASNNDFEVIGGYEYNDHTYSTFGAETHNYLTDAFGFNSLASGNTVLPPFSYLEKSRLVSFFSRANVGFAEKYFLTGVLRRDGSSSFGVGNKWAVFPAIQGSWRISQEGFMRGRTPFSELKLRAGWGKQGNPGVPPYASLILLSADNDARYVFGERVVTGVRPIRNPNPNLKWEATDQSSVALDYGLMANRITGTLEYYAKNTHDLLLSVAVPQPAVVGDRLENIGKTRNRGVEASLEGALFNRPNSNWTAGLVFSADRTTAVDLGGRNFIISGNISGQGQSNAPSERIIPGERLGTFYGPVFVGVNAQGQQMFNKYTVVRDSTGREISRTISGTTTSPGGDDKTILGNAQPNFTLGLHSQGNIGKFDISFLINSVQGQKVFNNTALVYGTKGNVLQNKNFLASALSDPTGVKEPAIFSSRWIEDGSFTRLANVTVGYTFDLPMLGGGGKNTRVYVSGDNLFLITSYTGYDPEVVTDAGLASYGIDYLHYPRPRTITGGVRVAF